MDRRSFLKGTAAASAAAALAPSFPSLGATEEAALYEVAKQDGEVIRYTAHFDTQTARPIFSKASTRGAKSASPVSQ